MTRDWIRLFGWTCAAFVFHLLSFATPYGPLRFELPFYLAYIVAVFGDRPWISGLTFFLPSILFDLLDGNFAGTLSHLVAYILIRRLKLLLNFNRIPACIFWGLILAFLDRAVYGTLVGLKAGAGTGWVLRSIIDPAYFLTVLFLPIGIIRRRP